MALHELEFEIPDALDDVIGLWQLEFNMLLRVFSMKPSFMTLEANELKKINEAYEACIGILGIGADSGSSSD